MRPHPNTYKRPQSAIRVRLVWAYPISAPATSCLASLPHMLRLKMKKKSLHVGQMINLCEVQMCLLKKKKKTEKKASVLQSCNQPLKEPLKVLQKEDIYVTAQRMY